MTEARLLKFHGGRDESGTAFDRETWVRPDGSGYVVKNYTSRIPDHVWAGLSAL